MDYITKHNFFKPYCKINFAFEATIFEICGFFRRCYIYKLKNCASTRNSALYYHNKINKYCNVIVGIVL